MYASIERRKLRVLLRWCPAWHKQIQGAASVWELAAREGTPHRFPRLSSRLPLPAIQSGGTARKNYPGIFPIVPSVLLSHFHRVRALSSLFLGVRSL